MSRSHYIHACLVLACASAAAQTQDARLLPSPRITSQIYGFSLDLGVGAAVVAAPFENNTRGEGAGAVYIYEETAGAWVQTLRLLPPTTQAFQTFGQEIALDGDRLLVGVPYRDFGGVTSAGVALLYERGVSGWTLSATLTPSNPIAYGGFGDIVDIQGDLIVIGGGTGPLGGWGDVQDRVAYIFERVNGVWTEAANLSVPSAISVGFNPDAAIATDGQRVVIGSSDGSPAAPGIGAVTIYEKLDGDWRQVALLTPAGEPVNTHFGNSVALDGDRVIVGARYETVAGALSAGAAYAFERDADGTWVQTHHFVNPDPAQGDAFGIHLDLEGDKLLIGAYTDDSFSGNGNAFHYHYSGGAWSDPTVLTPTGGTDVRLFGWRVALHDGRGLISAPFETSYRGAAYVFSGLSPRCSGDLDDSGDVGLQDLALLLSNFGSTGSGLTGDIDADGDVDLQDLATLLANFGVPC